MDDEIKKEILEEKLPLGHVLIQSAVHRHIHVNNFVQLLPGFAAHSWPGFSPQYIAYGRLGILYCNNQPAIELFEVIPDYH
ncbi:MAG TPA: hypothetical protein PKD72_14125 [Gemmatales bacterium]|nr:hypothetical protein [Gemmatales bacterium]